MLHRFAVDPVIDLELAPVVVEDVDEGHEQEQLEKLVVGGHGPRIGLVAECEIIPISMADIRSGTRV